MCYVENTKIIVNTFLLDEKFSNEKCKLIILVRINYYV